MQQSNAPLPPELGHHLTAFREFLSQRRPGLPASWLVDAVAVQGWVDAHGLPPIRPDSALCPLHTPPQLPTAEPAEHLVQDETPVIHADGARRRVALVRETPVLPQLSWVVRQHPRLLRGAMLLLGFVPVESSAWTAARYSPEQVVVSSPAIEAHPWLKLPGQVLWERLVVELVDWFAQHGFTTIGTRPVDGPKHTEVLHFDLSDGSAFEVTHVLSGYGLRVTGKYIPRPGQGVSVLGPLVVGYDIDAEKIFPDEWFFVLHRRVTGLQTIRL